MQGDIVLDRQKIGNFPQEVITLLGLNLTAEMPIYIGKSNVEHIKNRHPYEYDKYFCKIGEILSRPDYVGRNPSDESVTFVKLYQVDGEYIRVAVRVTTKGIAYAKTLHLLSTSNAERYIEKGTLKALTNTWTKV